MVRTALEALEMQRLLKQSSMLLNSQTYIYKRMNKNHNPAFLDVKKLTVMNFTRFSYPDASLWQYPKFLHKNYILC